MSHQHEHEHGREAPGGEDAGAPEPVYTYEDAGLREREGHVPLWLWLVVAALLAWGVYYLIANWHPPA